MNRYVCPPGSIVVKADMPVEKITASNLLLPPQRYEHRWELDERGFLEPFSKGEYQVVSAVVLSTQPSSGFSVNLPTEIANTMPHRSRMVRHGISEVYIEVPAPAEGSRVWFPYGIWAGMESSMNVGIIEDESGEDVLIGVLPIQQAYVSQSQDGKVTMHGAYILCEPIPGKIPPSGSLDISMVTHIANAGVVRAVGEISHLPHLKGLEAGMAVYHKGQDKLIAPNPFSQNDWMLVNAEDVVLVNPSFVDVPADLPAAWETARAHNNAIAGNTPLKMREGATEYHEFDVDENELDKLEEYRKQHIKMFKAKYRSKLWV